MSLLIATPDIFTVIEGILEWVEPDTAIKQDDALVRPVSYEPDTLYLYPDDEEHVAYESGPSARQNFRLVLDLIVDDEGESATGTRERDVTEALRERVAAIVNRVREHQRTLTHDFLRVARVEWNVLNGMGFRGARLRLDGYRLWA